MQENNFGRTRARLIVAGACLERETAGAPRTDPGRLSRFVLSRGINLARGQPRGAAKQQVVLNTLIGEELTALKPAPKSRAWDLVGPQATDKIASSRDRRQLPVQRQNSLTTSNSPASFDPI
jgi:hypothetical protein